MKDEIKEILDRWNKVCNNELEYVELTLEQMKLLLDYITNLQEENEKLKKQIGILCDSLDRRNKQVEKAIEINKKLQNISILDSRAVLWLSQQENILNGGDE